METSELDVEEQTSAVIRQSAFPRRSSYSIWTWLWTNEEVMYNLHLIVHHEIFISNGYVLNLGTSFSVRDLGLWRVPGKRFEHVDVNLWKRCACMQTIPPQASIIFLFIFSRKLCRRWNSLVKSDLDTPTHVWVVCNSKHVNFAFYQRTVVVVFVDGHKPGCITVNVLMKALYCDRCLWMCGSLTGWAPGWRLTDTSRCARPNHIISVAPPTGRRTDEATLPPARTSR